MISKSLLPHGPATPRPTTAVHLGCPTSICRQAHKPMGYHAPAGVDASFKFAWFSQPPFDTPRGVSAPGGWALNPTRRPQQ
jgi:hypothetical protein